MNNFSTTSHTVSHTTNESDFVSKKPFFTPYGEKILLTVYPVEGTYTIKAADGRDIREENKPIAHLELLTALRQDIRIWVKSKIDEYNANSTTNLNTNLNSNTDSNTDLNTDTSTDSSTP